MNQNKVPKKCPVCKGIVVLNNFGGGYCLNKDEEDDPDFWFDCDDEDNIIKYSMLISVLDVDNLKIKEYQLTSNKVVTIISIPGKNEILLSVEKHTHYNKAIEFFNRWLKLEAFS